MPCVLQAEAIGGRVGRKSLIRDISLTLLGVLAVLHDLTMAARYADRVAILEAGRMTALGPTETALDPAHLSQVFGTPILRLQAGATLAFVSPGETTPNRT